MGLRQQSCNKTARATNVSKRVGMEKVLGNKSANVRMKPTSYCRAVENMLIVRSKYIITRNKSGNICNKFFKMLRHANA